MSRTARRRQPTSAVRRARARALAGSGLVVAPSDGDRLMSSAATAAPAATTGRNRCLLSPSARCAVQGKAAGSTKRRQPASQRAVPTSGINSSTSRARIRRRRTLAAVAAADLLTTRETRACALRNNDRNADGKRGRWYTANGTNGRPFCCCTLSTTCCACRPPAPRRSRDPSATRISTSARRLRVFAEHHPHPRLLRNNKP
ncbi:hypothetical protein P171DRAFT_470887 [Karstenula rhodostoma CBS 690.94]|uniref:Uncharacterized protein n=1 Tax=Karstenula rhodostoma CBS 690.94 TaxID=1392251 RepID=A0A9P4PRJ0_9PLEO|nr:hypothetical protein P171DRAFT_470887 [Karstenula rhodostoma CBS 690.94]